ncbi:hypothetical protein SASPL_128097 [Salvia splendens]|uniref:starch synthase n=1 Tax=Salvia splendens TaxID=180675 RepID=A0A8X8XAN9_SALSN|nr:hypothetical protein SASPL_128097 [Salvia splendens]
METLHIAPGRNLAAKLVHNSGVDCFSGVRQVGFASLLSGKRKDRSFFVRARSYKEEGEIASRGSENAQKKETEQGIFLGAERDGTGSVVGFHLIPHSAISDERVLETREAEAEKLFEEIKSSDTTSPTATYNVVFVTSEAAPYSKTGGLGDVCGSLPIALAARGHRVMVVSPRYLVGGLSDKKFANAVDMERPTKIHCFGGVQEVGFFHEYRAGVDWVFVDHPSYHRPGTPYGDSFGAFGDNQFRFTLLCHAACEATLVLPLGGYTYGEKCLFIANDWHAGLVPVYLLRHVFEMAVEQINMLLAAKYRPHGVYKDARSIIVIHNLAHQGVEPAVTYKNLGLPPGWYKALEWVFPTWARTHALDPGEAVNVLKSAIVTADRIVTVSQIGFIGRLDYQKGVDILLSAAPDLMHDDVQLVMLGSGEKQYEDWMRQLESTYKDKYRGWVGFNVPISHRITAGCDILVMPSRFEPCGLNQLYAMRYGSVPVVHCTGGLRDTVQTFDPYANEGTGEGIGWAFSPLTKERLLTTLRIAVSTFREHKISWGGLMKRGMEKNMSWDNAAVQYEQVFDWAFIDPPYAG